MQQLIQLAVLSILLAGVVSLAANRLPLLTRYTAAVLQALGGLLAVYVGIATLISGSVYTWTLPLGLPWLPWHQRLDALSGFFLALVGIVVISVSLFGPRYSRVFRKTPNALMVLGISLNIFIASMLQVVLSDDAFSFMVAWEMMSVSSYFLVTFEHQNSANRRAGFIYLLMAQMGALFILLAFGVLGGIAGNFSFDAMRSVHASVQWSTLVFVFGLIGFGMKAGLVPVHIWLPEAHPVAPSHVSALMSGVMLKIAVYGFIRLVFDLIGEIHWAWGAALLIIASLSAIFGVLYALMQHDLKRLLAYHSVENIGIIFIGLALSLIFFGKGLPTLGVLGLIAALYHTINHAVFKSLLFLGAGAVIQSSREHDLDRMGGLLRSMPWTGIFFLVGCISISALPPFNGFVSEWLTFQTALQAVALKSGVLRVLIPASAAVLALTGALAATCFVKVYGIAFLGKPRSKSARKVIEVSVGMRFGQGLLAAISLVLGVMPTLVVAALNNIPQLLFKTVLPEATRYGWMWLTPISADVAAYSAPEVALGLLLALGVWAAIYFILRPKRRRARRTPVPAWDCGFGVLSSRAQYTAGSFSMPISRVFGPIWDVHEEASLEARNGLSLHSHTLRYRAHVEDISWRWIYNPLVAVLHRATRRISKIQTGHLRHYLAYSFFTLLVLLWLIS